jgi:hypothetical protein
VKFTSPSGLSSSVSITVVKGDRPNVCTP